MLNHRMFADRSYAIRIEGKKWVNDISIDQAWAILHAAYQELERDDELLFMVQLPSGEQPGKCMSKAIFELLMPTPETMVTCLVPKKDWKKMELYVPEISHITELHQRRHNFGKKRPTVGA